MKNSPHQRRLSSFSMALKFFKRCLMVSLAFVPSVIPPICVFGGKRHDLFLRRGLCIHFSGEPPAGHYKDAVAPAKLRHFRGHHDNSLALFGEVDDELIDLVLCTYVNAPVVGSSSRHLRGLSNHRPRMTLLVAAESERIFVS